MFINNRRKITWCCGQLVTSLRVFLWLAPHSLNVLMCIPSPEEAERIKHYRRGWKFPEVRHYEKENKQKSPMWMRMAFERDIIVAAYPSHRRSASGRRANTVLRSTWASTCGWYRQGLWFLSPELHLKDEKMAFPFQDPPPIPGGVGSGVDFYSNETLSVPPHHEKKFPPRALVENALGWNLQ